MIYKVFYQDSKVSPRREQTRSLYMEVEAESELQGRIIARELVEKKYPQYNIEFIELLSEKHLQYEKEHADFSITEF
ncbi:RNA polymerase epsilon subunit [Streptococcus parasuis]|uniref:RNA polymerase epsilon subunit n=1 Tax=Streptococcus parasuis TaxID=1501662 RepID=UPI0025A5A98B|nr:RNA polymerase epsilon subunit [Streptococcus parasuis]WJQ85136.1 RNA polymerase epsilon subunit [Streptococcus parasuis]